MKWLFATLLFAGCSFVTRDATEETIIAELEKFQGTWQLDSFKDDGKAGTGDLLTLVRVVIKDDKSTTYFVDDAVAKDTPFKLDPTKNPKIVDYQLPEGKKIHGIYELNGDMLKICCAEVDKDRPNDFDPKPNSGHIVRMFKRVKK